MKVGHASFALGAVAVRAAAAGLSAVSTRRGLHRPFPANDVFQTAGEPAATGNAFGAVVGSNADPVFHATAIDNRSAGCVIAVGAPR